MGNMKSIQLLIDMAREKAHGNEAALARQIGVPLHHPHEWRTGKRAVTAETAAALCDYLGLSGEEAREWLAIAVIENPKNAAKADMLRRALFVCWVLGVGSLMSLPNDARAMLDTSSSYRPETYGMHIVAHLLRLAASAVRLASWLCRTRSHRHSRSACMST